MVPSCRFAKTNGKARRLARGAALIFLAMSAAVAVHGQTYTILHEFTGGSDGGFPLSGVTLDRAGNLYGTTSIGGSEFCAGGGCGGVYRMQHRSGGWTLTPLFTFPDAAFAGMPNSRVVFGPDGTLYGTTEADEPGDYGDVFRLQPPFSICPAFSCPWRETHLYGFTNAPDGANPAGDVVFDNAGNLYGVTTNGGTSGSNCPNNRSCGTVYKLSRVQGGWQETVIYDFQGGDDGGFPNAVTFDSSSKLVGTTSSRGTNNRGTVFSLAPNGQGLWSETTLYSFSGGVDGGSPAAGVIPDGSGGFLGTTSSGGSGGGGTVWQLSPSGGQWVLTTLTSFNDGGEPASVLTMDAAGRLYGTTLAGGGFHAGCVYKLTHTNGGWTLTTLFAFNGSSDGGQPYSNVSIDAAGNLYGTARVGGGVIEYCFRIGCGVVWEITP